MQFLVLNQDWLLTPLPLYKDETPIQTGVPKNTATPVHSSKRALFQVRPSAHKELRMTWEVHHWNNQINIRQINKKEEMKSTLLS